MSRLMQSAFQGAAAFLLGAVVATASTAAWGTSAALASCDPVRSDNYLHEYAYGWKNTN